MNKLTFDWTVKDWSAKTFLISLNRQTVGTLLFNDLWTFNASYETDNATINFKETGYFKESIEIRKQDRPIGKIDYKVFGRKCLSLNSGQTFNLSTNFWGRNLKWINEKGENVLELKQPTLKDLGRGTILTDTDLDKELNDLLISSGLYISNLTSKKIARFMPLFIILIGGLKIFG